MRSVFAAAALALALLPPTHAGYGQGDARLEKLYATFLAPCCWRDNLAEHDSGEAARLRQRIAAMVTEGQSDEQIQGALIAEFGPRILTLPEGAPRAWLFWMPWLMGAAGLSTILLWLRHARRHPVPASGLAPAELPEGWDRE